MRSVVRGFVSFFFECVSVERIYSFGVYSIFCDSENRGILYSG